LNGIGTARQRLRTRTLRLLLRRPPPPELDALPGALAGAARVRLAQLLLGIAVCGGGSSGWGSTKAPWHGSMPPECCAELAGRAAAPALHHGAARGPHRAPHRLYCWRTGAAAQQRTCQCGLLLGCPGRVCPRRVGFPYNVPMQ
jgi:hypothetical protein